MKQQLQLRIIPDIKLRTSFSKQCVPVPGSNKIIIRDILYVLQNSIGQFSSLSFYILLHQINFLDDSYALS